MPADDPRPDPTPTVARTPPTRPAADSGGTGSLADPAATTGGVSATAADAPAPPASTPRYELGAEIARGGWGRCTGRPTRRSAARWR